MKYRAFGSSGLEISEVVFGAGAVGGVVFRPEREKRLAAVRRALELGINWIDTAPLYGNGQSEENLGWILKELGALPHVSTKVRIGAEHMDDALGEIARSLEGSLERLGMERVELLQLHTPVTRERGARSIGLDDVLGSGGVADGLERVREQGLVRLTGFTGFGDADCLHELVTSGRFDSVQAYYNLLNPSAGRPVSEGFPGQDFGDLIGLASRRGMGVINIRALSAGVIAGLTELHPATAITPGSSADADVAHTRAIREALGERAGSMAQTALRYVLMNPGVSGVAIGFSELAHIEEAAAAVDLGPLSAEVIAALNRLHELSFSR